MKAAPQDSEKREESAHSGRQVARASGTVSFFTLVSRVLGLVRDMATAHFFGADIATDAFFTAYRIPNLLRRLVAEGSLAVAFVPVFAEELRNGKAQAQQAIKAVTGFCLVLTVGLTLLGMLFSSEITQVFALGWTDQPEKLALAASLLRTMFPYLILVSFLALLSGALNALGIFGIPAAAPAVLNVAFIIAIVLFHDSLSVPIYVLAYALLIGGFFALLPQLFLLHKKGYSAFPGSPFHSPAVRQVVHLMLPAIVSASVYQIMVLVNTTFATMQEEGTQTWLYYADRIFQFPLGVFSLAVATAVLPSFSHLSASGDTNAFNKLLTAALGWIAFITLPATVGLIVLAEPLITLFFQGGKFGSHDAQMTAWALSAYAVGLWTLSSHSILVRAFLAKKNTRIPAFIAVLTISINILLCIALMGPPLQPDANTATRLLVALQHYLAVANLSHVGLALAGSLASLVSMSGLVLLLSDVGLAIHWKELLFSIGRAIAASLFMLLGLRFLVASNLPATMLVLIAVPLGGLLYGFTAWLLRSKEACQCVERILIWLARYKG